MNRRILIVVFGSVVFLCWYNFLALVDEFDKTVLPPNTNNGHNTNAVILNNSRIPIIMYPIPVSGFMGKHMIVPPKNCPVQCIYTENRTLQEEADALVFLVIGISVGSIPKKRPGQYFVALSMESAEYYPNLLDKEFMSHFDMKMSYLLDSEFPMFYISSKANYSTPPREDKNKDVLISIFISNSGPLNQRNAYTQKLMELLPCHSYGAYLRNRYMPPNTTKIDVLRKYKFHLAFENSNTQDYVTEKIFHAFQAGTVPIYMGAPNIDDYTPSNHSIIKVTDFPSIEALADYVGMLSQNDEEYNKYLSWKHEGFSKEWKKILSIVRYDARCRLCMKLHGLPFPKWDQT